MGGAGQGRNVQRCVSVVRTEECNADPPRADEQGIPGSLRHHMEAVAGSKGSLHCLLIFNHFFEVSVHH